MNLKIWTESFNFFLTCEKLGLCFSRSGNLEKAQTYSSRGMLHNIFEIKPVGSRGIFPHVFISSPPANAYHHMSYCCSTSRVPLSGTMTWCLVTEERNVRQLRCVAQSVHRHDKREMVSSWPQILIIVAKNNRRGWNLFWVCLREI